MQKGYLPTIPLLKSFDPGLVKWIRAGALDDFSNSFLDQIPVGSVDADHLDLVVVLDVFEVFPACLVVDKANGDTDTSETTGTTDTVEIGLRVWATTSIVGDILSMY